MPGTWHRCGMSSVAGHYMRRMVLRFSHISPSPPQSSLVMPSPDEKGNPHSDIIVGRPAHPTERPFGSSQEIDEKSNEVATVPEEPNAPPIGFFQLFR